MLYLILFVFDSSCVSLTDIRYNRIKDVIAKIYVCLMSSIGYSRAIFEAYSSELKKQNKTILHQTREA